MSEAAITFFGGKGGVGKTTQAAAHALALADSGRRTLLVSTDPAHSLGDVLEVRLGDRPREVVENLWAAEPDADAAVRRRVAEVADDARAAVPPEIMPAVRRHLEHAAAAPGMTESALGDRLVGYLERVPGEWDRLVVDSAPTGHLLRMLALPTLLTPWIRGLARQRERAVAADRFAEGILGEAERTEDPLLEKLHARRLRLETAARRLRSDAVVCLVTLPRRMVLAETRRAAEALTDRGFTLGTGVVNQVPSRPDEHAMEEAREVFAACGFVESPLLDREPVGVESLRALPSPRPQRTTPPR